MILASSPRAARFSSHRLRRLATRALVGGLGSGGAARLSRELRASERDRLAYGRLVELYRVLEGDPALSSGQHERILDGIRASLAAEAGRRAPAASGRLLPILAPALASLLLVLVATFGALRRPELDAGLAPRGNLTLGATGAGRVGLSAFCIRGGSVVPPPPRVADGPDARCRIDDELQLVITHTASHPRLLVLGLIPGADTRELYYYPLPPSGRSGPAPRETIDQPVDRAVRLQVNHRPGTLRIVALFSHLSIEAGQVHAWLRTLAPTEPAAPLLERLGRGAEETEVVELRIEIEGKP